MAGRFSIAIPESGNDSGGPRSPDTPQEGNNNTGAPAAAATRGGAQDPAGGMDSLEIDTLQHKLKRLSDLQLKDPAQQSKASVGFCSGVCMCVFVYIV